MNYKVISVTVGGLLMCTQSVTWAVGDQDLAVQISKRVELDVETVSRVVEVTKEAIVENLRNGEEVRLKNFGRFYKETRAPREARNPGTGEAVQVPERAYLRFKPFDSGHERLR